jgi:hypothetical protein
MEQIIDKKIGFFDIETYSNAEGLQIVCAGGWKVEDSFYSLSIENESDNILLDLIEEIFHRKLFYYTFYT